MGHQFFIDELLKGLASFVKSVFDQSIELLIIIAMKRNFIILVSLTMLLSLFPARKASAFEVDPRAKVFLIMTAYGTVGGFLLGGAMLAFDAPSRSPFVGASLGLYSGILFGSYVVVSHQMEEERKKNPQNYLEEDAVDDDPFGNVSSQVIQEYHSAIPSYLDLRQPGFQREKSFYINLVRYSF